ncbi:MAG: phenylacetate--CoA ligase family protein [Anaerolineales bacterium]|nr:phenylacetate--CoA ligase family protein [Anaerolineales bacterium]
MTSLETLYLKMPPTVQNTLCSLQGWRIQQSRYGKQFYSFLDAAEHRTFWSVEKTKQYRDKRLHAFIQHAYETVPFYRDHFQKTGILPEEIKTLEDLGKLPILTKEEVQKQYTKFVSTAIPDNKQIIAHTSGTTGGGLRFATTTQASQEQWAIWWRYRRWHGLQTNAWCGYFGGRSVVPLPQNRPPFWRYNYPGRQILFSAYHMRPDNMILYVNELRRSRPPWLHGYPSLLALLASFMLENGLELGYRIQWITIGAENLLPQQIELMQRAFGVSPRQHYGMAEAVANFSECEYGRLHVDEDFAAVEFLPNPNGPGYKVIGTNFSNPATPLLRYDIQDLVTLADSTCPCARPGRIVGSVDGRAEDYVILKNGARLGRMDHIFKDSVNVREAQIYQREIGQIIIRIVRSTAYSDQDETELLQSIRRRTGNDTEIEIEYVAALARSKTGKLRFVVSDIPEGQLKQAYQ